MAVEWKIPCLRPRNIQNVEDWLIGRYQSNSMLSNPVTFEILAEFGYTKLNFRDTDAFYRMKNFCVVLKIWRFWTFGLQYLPVRKI